MTVDASPNQSRLSIFDLNYKKFSSYVIKFKPLGEFDYLMRNVEKNKFCLNEFKTSFEKYK